MAAEVGARSVDALRGWVDGVLTTINPFQDWLFDATFFGGAAFGHDGYYTGGYVAGVVTGVAGQIALGAMSGGCSLFAAGSTLARLAQVYTVVDTVAGMVQAGQHIANGNVGIGDVLAFAPAVGYGAAKLGLLCFVEDTQVVVDVNQDGSYVTRSIQDIRVGDYVLCRDQYDPDAPLVKQQVLETFAHETDAVRTLAIQDASGNVETLTTTDEHPFWVDQIGWVAAKDLATGTVVTTADGRTAIVVENYAQLLDTPAMVYNLEVADGHTYFVEDGQGAQTAIWVHNRCALAGKMNKAGVWDSASDETHHILPKGLFRNRKAEVQQKLSDARALLNRFGIGLDSLRWSGLSRQKSGVI
ncbi:MAG: polymorphic toxin-type HINT domain-containing protein, partial [Planctomycetia bacterium]|nr:polymorphic toxin-type HINT domain-containing protein [Planctomycetia bacterium]